MAKGSQLVFYCVWAIWVMMLTCGSAEREYFLQDTNATWAVARNHCKLCFEELVTLTPDNGPFIVHKLSSEYWIGLRKRPVNAFDNSTLYSFNDTTSFWSRWANGDPLTFQNWYPGYPVFKSPYPKQECCSCSCTCPSQPTVRPTTIITQNITPTSSTNPTVTTNSTDSSQKTTNDGQNTTAYMTPVTHTPMVSECDRRPMLFQDVPDLDKNYIEDSCVAILSFGAWVEKTCWDHLPFICYEDKFYGEVNVTDIKATSATLKWEKAPGDIDHYRVEVNNLQYDEVRTDLSISVRNLTAGTRYKVEVFPVKCGRDLNSENGTFYTVPNKVSDLKIVSVTENCVSLKWNKSSGNVDRYSVITRGQTPRNVMEPNASICDLIPGSLHDFNVQAGFSNWSTWSFNSTISAYTKPAKVSNLRAQNITENSLFLVWDKPKGDATNYFVSWFYSNGGQVVSGNHSVADNKLGIQSLPSGTRITLKVTALANYSLQGESQTVEYFTWPEKVTELKLHPTKDSINVTWNYNKGSPNFTVQLHFENKKIETENINKPTVQFKNLKSAAYYTVTVYSVSGGNLSNGVNESIFTLPEPPRGPVLSNTSKTHLTFTWTPPLNTKTVDYVVSLNSTFWNIYENDTLKNDTMYTFGGLTSGSSYSFQVRTMAGTLLSDPITLTAQTEPALKEITLSMVCSSVQPLHCDDSTTRDSAFAKLNSTFKSVLGDNVHWKLMKMEGANTGN